MRRMNIGLQMYTLRDETAQDFRGTLRKVAELGYEGVEFAGYGDIPAEEMKTLLQELGLKAIGSHVGLHLLRADLQKEIDYLKTIGAKYMMCPYVAEEDRKDAEDWKNLFSFLEEVGAEARKQGLIFGYHNHAFEFEAEVEGQFVLMRCIPQRRRKPCKWRWTYAGYNSPDKIRSLTFRNTPDVFRCFT